MTVIIHNVLWRQMIATPHDTLVSVFTSHPVYLCVNYYLLVCELLSTCVWNVIYLCVNCNLLSCSHHLIALIIVLMTDNSSSYHTLHMSYEISSHNFTLTLGQYTLLWSKSEPVIRIFALTRALSHDIWNLCGGFSLNLPHWWKK